MCKSLFALIACLLCATCLRAQPTALPTHFDITGSVIDETGKPVAGAEVVLVLERSYGDRWEIEARATCDDRGGFVVKAPLHATVLRKEWMILVLPTEKTGSALHYYKGPHGFNDNSSVFRNEYRVAARQKIQLRVKNEAGQAIENVELNHLLCSEEPFYHDFMKLFPELRVKPSDEQGQLTIDWCGWSREREMILYHPQYAVWRRDDAFRKAANWNDHAISLDVTLAKGEPVTVEIEDLRKQDRGQPIRIFQSGFTLRGVAPQISFRMDWSKDSSQSISFSASPNSMVKSSRIQVSRQWNTVQLRICDPKLVRGFLRDEITKFPLPRRRIYVNSTKRDYFSSDSVSALDGYFEVLVADVDSPWSFTVHPNGRPDYQHPNKVQLDQLQPPIQLWDKLRPEKLIVLKPEPENKNLVCAVQTAGSMPDLKLFGIAQRLEATTMDGSEFDLYGYALNVPLSGRWKGVPGSYDRVEESFERVIPLRRENVVRGRVVTKDGSPSGWLSVSVYGLAPPNAQPPFDFHRTFSTSSLGRFAMGAVPQSQELELRAESTKKKIPALNESIDVGDIQAHPYSQVNIPEFNFHVDEWICGEPENVDEPERQIPVLISHGSRVPTDILRLLRQAYPTSQLRIIAIHYPGEMETTTVDALRAELALRKCNFSIGVDRQARTRAALPGKVLLFNFPHDEVFRFDELDLRGIRDVMLHMR